MFYFSKVRLPFLPDLIKHLFKAVLLDEDLLGWRFILKKKINTEGNVISEEKNQFNLSLLWIVLKESSINSGFLIFCIGTRSF